jgi:acyl carrier protein
MDALKTELRQFVVTNFLFGAEEGPADDASFLEEGIIDSTGVLELVAHLQQRYGIRVEDDEIIPDNLDSIEALAAFVRRKQDAAEPSRSVAGGTA